MVDWEGRANVALLPGTVITVLQRIPGRKITLSPPASVVMAQSKDNREIRVVGRNGDVLEIEIGGQPFDLKKAPSVAQTDDPGYFHAEKWIIQERS